jgi:aconitase B
MTRDELKDLACLGFSADLVMQVCTVLPHLRRAPSAQFTCFTGTKVQILTQMDIYIYITKSFCRTAAYPKAYLRCSVYLLYWYKSTNTDTGGGTYIQSFCHTAAYPKPVDVVTHATLPDFIRNRGGVSLRPGDGIIHSWLNRMLLPDTVGTGGDSFYAHYI